MTDVVVVGAGFAGLAAAASLAGAGVDVVVLEARDRIGGRVWSDSVRAPDGTSCTVERGAEFVLQGYTTMEGLVDEHGLALVSTGMSYYVREPWGVSGVSAEALGRAGRAIASAARAGAGSVRDAVATAGLSPPVAQAVLARVEISSGLEAGHLTPMVLDHLASFEPLPSHRIAGGNGRLARALSESLGIGRVRLDTPAFALDRRGTRIRVLTDDGEVEADRVVLTLPVPVLRSLTIDPPLPDWKRRALARVEIGHAAKLHIALGGSAATSAVMSVPDRFWCWTALDPNGRVAPVLNCFAGTSSALKRLAVDDGPATWIERVSDVRRDLELVTEAAVMTTWHDDPWALGAYRASGLKAVEESELTAPVGAVHFAGEYTAGALSGLMEGALRSGLRTAAEICRVHRLKPRYAADT